LTKPAKGPCRKRLRTASRTFLKRKTLSQNET